MILQIMLISVHLPKTGGSTFRSILQNHFHSNLYLDYTDYPMTHSTFNRLGKAWVNSWIVPLKAHPYACIHGHFLPLKYKRLSNPTFITWLRDPVERVISRYYYFTRTQTHSNVHLDRYIKNKDISLEDFCEIEHYQNIYAKYLYGFDLEFFTFIGITERYTESLKLFENKLNIPIQQNSYTVNANPFKNTMSYEVSKKIRDRITATNKLDVTLYYTALKKHEILYKVIDNSKASIF